jgi:hypothetical protein
MNHDNATLAMALPLIWKKRVESSFYELYSCYNGGSSGFYEINPLFFSPKVIF